MVFHMVHMHLHVATFNQNAVLSGILTSYLARALFVTFIYLAIWLYCSSVVVDDAVTCVVLLACAFTAVKW